MPVTLPSGLTLWLDGSHILEPDRNWFKAPENHFWYMTPDEENLPPFSPDDVYWRRPETALIPQSREEMECYINVPIEFAGGKAYWRGDMLADFPRYGMLSSEDFMAWRKWLETEIVREFLDRVITYCKTQAEINKEAVGYAVLYDMKEDEDGNNVGKKYIDNPLKDSN